MSTSTREDAAWWRTAVIYEIYPRSFTDANGDGHGDLPGITSRLGYLRELGVDAIWIAPWYPSPMADGGYDVADYKNIHPLYGTLEDARAAARRGAPPRAAGHPRPRRQPHVEGAPLVPRRRSGRARLA